MGTPACLTQRREDAKALPRQAIDHALDSVVSLILASQRGRSEIGGRCAGGRWANEPALFVIVILCVLCVSVVQFGAVTVIEGKSPQRRRAHREDLNQQKGAKTRKGPKLKAALLFTFLCDLLLNLDPAMPFPALSLSLWFNSGR